MKKTKIILSNYGSFCFSDEAVELYRQLSGRKADAVPHELACEMMMWFNPFSETYRGLEGRMDKHLIEVVERLGAKASEIDRGFQIVEVERGRKFQIDSYGEMFCDEEYIAYRDEMGFCEIPARPSFWQKIFNFLQLF